MTSQPVKNISELKEVCLPLHPADKKNKVKDKRRSEGALKDYIV